MAQTELRSTGQTGTICKVTALYSSKRHADMPMFIWAGATFPVDAIDGLATSWSTVKTTASAISTSPTAEI